MNPVQSLLRALAVLLFIVLPLAIGLAYAGAPTFAILLTAVIVQCSAVAYLLARRKR